MDHFHYRDGQLFAEHVQVTAITERWGTPCYIYSRATLERHWKVFDQALGHHEHLICYAVKANSNLAVLNVLARLGSGFDIVSGGELERVLAAGGDPKKIVFSGVGKLEWEIVRALEVDIYCFNVESSAELVRINQIAERMGKRASVSIRVNPDVNAKTHPYISTGLKENKFGVAPGEAISLYEQTRQLKNLQVTGIDCHIGSQLTELEPLVEATVRIMELAKDLEKRGFKIHHLDLGGGLGVRYRDEQPPEPIDYARVLFEYLAKQPYKIILEPGRAIAANAGILVTKIEYLKYTPHKNFAIVDAGMNDLIRPALYHAEHEIIPVISESTAAMNYYDIVGPVCETGDFLGKERRLMVYEGDLLAVRTAGAYGFSMSSNYNSRPRAAEIMVDNDQCYLVRERESIPDLYVNEFFLPE